MTSLKNIEIVIRSASRGGYDPHQNKDLVQSVFLAF